MDNQKKVYHIPVLMREVLAYLQPQEGKVYVDVTFGGGGHTRAILASNPTCRVISFDWDKNAIDMNAPALQEEFGDRFQIVWGNFSQLQLHLKKIGVHKVDGILADFGTSQYQIKEKAGFSFASDTPLDMRMSPAHQKTTAADLLNFAEEQELTFIFREYGEISRAHAVAKAICFERKNKKFKTTGDLVQVLVRCMPKKGGRGIHPATQVFQALRIFVNKELENIHSFLLQAMRVLAPAGRLVCISFHSLEDRLVKHFLKEHKDCFSILTSRAIMAQPDEVKSNPSSRSARLRAAERLFNESC